jgi:hypothetical protein
MGLTLLTRFSVPLIPNTLSGEGPKTAEQWFDTVLPASELQNLPDRKFYLQTLVDGHPNDPLRIDAFPPLQKEHMFDLWKRKGRTAEKNSVIRQSLDRYGRDRAFVEAKLNQFMVAA